MLGLWGEVVGTFTGDSIKVQITQEKVRSVTQYIQDMGYDIQTFGFADVVYEKDSDGKVIGAPHAKKVKKIIPINDDKKANDYLTAYLAADAATYMPAHFSLRGAFLALGEGVVDILTDGLKTAISAITGDEITLEKTDYSESSTNSIDSKSTGMINLLFENLEGSDGGDAKEQIKFDSKKRKIIVYAAGVYDQFTGVTSKGEKLFSINTDNWTAQFGRPLELFIALHTSTMMPDLAQTIATDERFNTKVNIGLNKVKINYDVKVKDKETDKYATFSARRGSGYRNFKSVVNDALITTGKIEEEDDEDEDEKLELFRTLAIQIKSYQDFDFSATYDGIDFTSEEMMDIIKILGAGSKEKEVFWPMIETVEKHWFYGKIDFIGQDDETSHGVYKRASKAKKKIDYTPENEEGLFEKYKVELDGVLTPVDDSGSVFYQVTEPELRGARTAIKDIFTEKYYRYDGTPETAKKIAIAKAIEREEEKIGPVAPELVKALYDGEELTVTADHMDEYEQAKKASEDNDTKSEYYESAMGKKEVNFKNNKRSALQSFAVLENMKTEAGDTNYRQLKELVKELEYFEVDELLQVDKNVFLYILDNGEKSAENDWDPEAKNISRGKLSKDNYLYKLVIKDIIKENMKIISPYDAEAKYEDGKLILKFGTMNDETYNILEFRNHGGRKVEDKDYLGNFKKIDKELVNGYTLIIDGIKNPGKTRFSRGEVICDVENNLTETGSNYNGKIELQLLKDDKEPVDNIETFFSQHYTKTDEELLKSRKDSPNRTLKGLKYVKRIIQAIRNWMNSLVNPSETLFYFQIYEAGGDYSVVDLGNGGVGAFQFTGSSKIRFLRYAYAQDPVKFAKFEPYTRLSSFSNDTTFKNIFSELSSKYPEDMKRVQDEFALKEYYDPIVTKLANLGFDINSRPDAVKGMFMSLSIRAGNETPAKVVRNAGITNSDSDENVIIKATNEFANNIHKYLPNNSNQWNGVKGRWLTGRTAHNGIAEQKFVLDLLAKEKASGVFTTKTNLTSSGPVKLDQNWQYASNSVINSGSAQFYKATANRKNKVIAVNAGHGTNNGHKKATLSHPDGTPKVEGGTNPRGAVKSTAVSTGMTFKDGTPEATVTIQIAKQLRDELLKRGYDVMMLRDGDDVQLDNVARTVIANNTSDVHISLHWDSTETDKGAYYMSPTDVGGFRNMSPVKENWQKHIEFGKKIIDGLKSNSIKIHQSGEQKTDLTQISYSTIPTIALEIGDKASDHLVSTTLKQSKAIADGIDKYFGGS